MRKLLSLIRSHLLISIFIFLTPKRWVKKDFAAIYVKECSACVFLWEFYTVWPYIQVSTPFWVYFVYGIRECSNFILFRVAI